MKTAGIAVLALASWLTVPAFANDGGDPVPAPTGEAKPAPRAEARPESPPEAKPEVAKGEDFCPSRKGPCLQEDGSCAEDCPGAKTAPTDLDVLVLAALEGECAGAKAVLASFPEEARAKVDESRKAAFDFIVRAQKEMVVLHRELEQACAEAKADGKEVSCEVKSALGEDIKAIHGKVRERVATFAGTIEKQLAAEKVQALAAEVRKAGDVALALKAKVVAAVEKALAEEAPKCKEAPEGDCGEGEKKPGCPGAKSGPQ